MVYINVMFKFLKKKSPQEAIREDLSKIEIGHKAINLGEPLSKYDRDILLDVLQQEIDAGKLKGKLVGRKGWFLPGANNLLDQAWSKLMRGGIDLEKTSKEWGGLGNKRVFIALEELGREKKQNDPIFSRSGDIIYLNSYLAQQLINAYNSYNFDEGVQFEKIMETVSMPPDHKPIFEKFAQNKMQEAKFDYRLGSDGMVRKVGELPHLVNDAIAQQFEENSQVLYSDLGDKFGVGNDVIGKIILDLIDQKELEDITNYPLDEKIVKKA